MKRSLIFIALSIAVLLTIHYVLPATQPSQQSERAELHHAPPKYLKHMAFGFNDIIADMLWLRFIQDIDYCREFEWASEWSATACKKGWGYQMLLSVHELAPKFRIPMAVGPISLSVLQDDIQGAHELFIKAAESFPTDWPILYRAGYHFIYEANDPEKAARYLNQAAEHGGPEWLKSLAARLYQKEGRVELALRTLTEYKSALKDPKAIKKVDERINALKASLEP